MKAVDVAYVAVPALFVWDEGANSTLHQEIDSLVRRKNRQSICSDSDADLERLLVW